MEGGAVGHNFKRGPRKDHQVPKFELYKHNDELFNLYSGIFYELWTFTDFDRLWNLKKGGMKLKKNLAAILDTGRRWRTQFWKGTT
jgi:hypothetical protein